MSQLAKVCNVPMQSQEPREYRHIGEVKHCVMANDDGNTCYRPIHIDAVYEEDVGGRYVRGVGWCCSNHYLVCLEGEENE